MTATQDDFKKLFGEDFEIDETPETIAFGASLDFATEVIQEMDKQNLKLKDLAQKIGVRPSTLCEKLNGKSNLTLKSAAEIAFALGYSLEAPRLCQKETYGAPSKATSSTYSNVQKIEHLRRVASCESTTSQKRKAMV